MEDKLLVTAHPVFQKIAFPCEAALALPRKQLFHYAKS